MPKTKLPGTLDTRWFIVLPNNAGIVYTPPGGNALEAWQNFSDAEEPLGTGIDSAKAFHMGFRAKRCAVVLVKE